MKSVGFENGVMEIEFPTGGIYTYHGPKVEGHYKGLMAADSKGSYFNKHIRVCPDTTYKRLPGT
jgi:hypothetical protein